MLFGEIEIFLLAHQILEDVLFVGGYLWLVEPVSLQVGRERDGLWLVGENAALLAGRVHVERVAVLFAGWFDIELAFLLIVLLEFDFHL